MNTHGYDDRMQPGHMSAEVVVLFGWLSMLVLKGNIIERGYITPEVLLV